MYAIYETSGLRKTLMPFGTFADLAAVEDYLRSRFGIVLFELDPDGHDAADAITDTGRIFAIEVPS